MENNHENLYKLCEKITADVDKFYKDHTGETGKIVATEEMIADMDTIVKEGATVYKYIVENKFYEGKPEILIDVNKFGEQLTVLQMTEDNAKKLDVQSAYTTWKAMVVVAAKLACDVLDFRDSLN